MPLKPRKIVVRCIISDTLKSPTKSVTCQQFQCQKPAEYRSVEGVIDPYSSLVCSGVRYFWLIGGGSVPGE